MAGTTIPDALSPLRGEPGRFVDPQGDPLERSRRANRRILVGFAVAVQAARRGSFGVAALAIARCTAQLHDVQRLDALHLYPAIARRFADDVETTAAVAAMRRDANAHARHFLRLVDGLFTRARPGMPPPEVLAEAEQALSAYLAGKESQLYRFYGLAVHR